MLECDDVDFKSPVGAFGRGKAVMRQVKEAIDIDEEDDFLLAEAIYSSRLSEKWG